MVGRDTGSAVLRPIGLRWGDSAPNRGPRLSRHVRMEAKRRALDEIALRRRTADEKRTEEPERIEQDARAFLQAAVVQ